MRRCDSYLGARIALSLVRLQGQLSQHQLKASVNRWGFFTCEIILYVELADR